MKIVIVSEDKDFLRLAASMLAVTGHDVTSTPGSAADLRTLAKALAPDDVLHPDVLSRFAKHRGPQKAPKKIPVSIRLNASVVSHFRQQGPGWQARIDAALTKIVEGEKKAAPKQKRPHVRVRKAG